MDRKQSGSEINKDGKDKNQKHTLRNALIVIIVCGVVVIILLAALLPRRGNKRSDESEGGRLTATETIYDNSEVNGYVEYIYNDDELLASQIWYDAPDGTEHRIEYDYDKDGNMTSRDITYYDGSERKYEYTYESFEDIRKTSDHTRL